MFFTDCFSSFNTVDVSLFAMRHKRRKEISFAFRSHKRSRLNPPHLLDFNIHIRKSCLFKFGAETMVVQIKNVILQKIHFK